MSLKTLNGRVFILEIFEASLLVRNLLKVLHTILFNDCEYKSHFKFKKNGDIMKIFILIKYMYVRCVVLVSQITLTNDKHIKGLTENDKFRITAKNINWNRNDFDGAKDRQDWIHAFIAQYKSGYMGKNIQLGLGNLPVKLKFHCLFSRG